MQIAFCWHCFGMINYTFSIISFRSSIYFGLLSFVAMPIKSQCVLFLQSTKETSLNQVNFNVGQNIKIPKSNWLESAKIGNSSGEKQTWFKKTTRSNLERKSKSVFFSDRNCNRKIRVRKLVNCCSLLQKECASSLKRLTEEQQVSQVWKKEEIQLWNILGVSQPKSEFWQKCREMYVCARGDFHLKSGTTFH